ncbi:MAG: hypothetical protein KKC46_08875 [Proteobacteria bacterium]|nr:hypothetical protein [Pseudomonadota bacterium]
MSRITERLSSLNFAVWTFVVLLLWFVWGLILASNKDFFKLFKEMNSVLTIDWLINPLQGTTQLKLWFIGLCLVMVGMGVNLIFCSWNRILKMMRHRFSGAKLFMLIVHIIFGFVALGHLGGFMMGYKHGDVSLFKNEVFSLENTYDLKITDIHFVDDPKVLQKSRREIMNNELNYNKNYAEVTLNEGDRLLAKGRIYLLRPLYYKDIQITLKWFLSPVNEDETLHALPGVKLAIACNPVLQAFLVIYPLMILGIAIHLIMTWKHPDKGDTKEGPTSI